MSSSNGQAWRLQENNSTKERWNNRGLWGATAQSSANTGKKNIGWTSMDRRNMVQSQTWLQATKANNSKANVHTNRSTRIKGDATEHSTSNKTYIQEANWQDNDNTDSFSRYDNSNTTSQAHSKHNRRVLDQRRTSMEESSPTSENRSLHTTTNTWWTRCHTTRSSKDDICQTNKWQQAIQTRWRLDNKDKSNIEHTMDSFNKLRRTSIIQRWIPHSWRGGTTTSSPSKRTQKPGSTNTTGTGRAQPDTFTLQELVQTMHSKQKQIRCTSKATTQQQSTSSTIWPLLLQVARWTKDNTHSHRNWCGNRHGNGSGSQQQDTRLQLPRTMHTIIPDGMWKSTSSTQQHGSTVRSSRTSHIIIYWKQQQQSLETTLQFDNHQHTHHNHKEVLKDSTEH